MAGARSGRWAVRTPAKRTIRSAAPRKGSIRRGPGYGVIAEGKCGEVGLSGGE